MIEVIDAIVTSETDSAEKQDGGPSSMFLRLIRLCRLLRIARVVRFSTQLRITLLMMCESVKSTGYMAILLLTFFYAFSVCFTMAATDFTRSDAPLEKKVIVKDYYGDVLSSILTCYKSMSGGLNWGDALAPLFDIGLGYVAVFLIYITISIFAILNIVTA